MTLGTHSRTCYLRENYVNRPTHHAAPSASFVNLHIPAYIPAVRHVTALLRPCYTPTRVGKIYKYPICIVFVIPSLFLADLFCLLKIKCDHCVVTKT